MAARARAGCQAARRVMPAPGLEVRIADEGGAEVPHDGAAMGRLLIRGPWIAASSISRIRRRRSSPRLARHGRHRDARRRGLYGNRRPLQGPGQERGRVDFIGRPGERDHGARGRGRGGGHRRQPPALAGAPARLRRKKAGGSGDQGGSLRPPRRRFAKWWLPDEVVFLDAIPKTSVGKFDKKCCASSSRIIICRQNNPSVLCSEKISNCSSSSIIARSPQ